ncbi:MAG: hypothetical protein K940chlam8_01083 [Chlamydiae bacterium]|nr:hypothetical protein [Chlamydiota bacterium]
MFIQKILGKFSSKTKIDTHQLGAFEGVFLPSALTMFGAILFIRLGWIVGNVGLVSSILILIISFTITMITSLSLSATATNMKVKGGGIYYMISRSFGLEIGASIGLSIFLKLAVSITFCAFGFAESLCMLFPFLNPKIVTFSVITILFVFASFSMRWVIKTQILIFGLIFLGLFSLFFANPIPLGEAGVFTSQLSFWQAFAIFYPASCGIEVGAAMSSRLKDPKKALPLGTLGVALFGFVVYLLVAINFSLKVPPSILANNPLIATTLSILPPLVFVGIWAAVLSSAIGEIVAAPQILKTLANDRVLPKWIAKDFGSTKEPWIASIITYLISSSCVLIGGLNYIAPILAMFCLICYAVLNLATGMEAFLENPSWRPQFKVWFGLPLFGSLLCFSAMLMINAQAAFGAFVFVILVFLLMKKRKIMSHWDDITQGILLFFSRFSIYRLASLKPSHRSWRPNFLVLSQQPSQLLNSDLLEFTHAMTKGRGFLQIGSVVVSEKASLEMVARLKKVIADVLNKDHLQALVEVTSSQTQVTGFRKIMDSFGLGPLAPNTIVLEVPQDPQMLMDVCQMIKLASMQKRNVVLIRGHKKEKRYRNLQIWWDDQYKTTSELNVLFAHMLQKSSIWKKSNLYLKEIINNESERENKFKKYSTFFKESRFIIDLDLKIATTDEEMNRVFNLTAKNADFCFLSSRPILEEESLEEYSTYLKELFEKTKELPSCGFVTAYQELDLKQILTS